LWSTIALRVAKNPRKSWIITGSALLILAFFSTTLRADGIGTVDTFVSKP
jgi:RND superfamily putative drug exporter